jgi:ParB family chromosome partitioning protein
MNIMEFPRTGNKHEIPLELLTIPKDGDGISRNEFGDLESLAISLKNNGQLQPITVRISDDTIIVCDGSRRVKAAYLANEKHGANIQTMICCAEKKGTKEDDRIIMKISANNSKEFTQIELGQGFKVLIDKHEWSILRIAASIGKSSTFVRDCIALAEAPEHVKKAVKEKRMKPTTAKKILHSDPKTRETVMLQSDLGKKVTGKDVEQAKEEQKEPDIIAIYEGLLSRGWRKADPGFMGPKPNNVIRFNRVNPPFLAILEK